MSDRVVGRRHLVVTGPMGVGKSTLADRLAAALDRPVRDSDRDIETVFGRSGGELAGEHGVSALHRLEAAMLLGALATSSPSVISAAASIVEDARCREALARRARTIVLTAPTDTLVERASAGDHRRPMTAAEFEEVGARRTGYFDEVASVTLDARRPPDELVEETVAAMARLAGLGTDDPEPA